jgi:hypothetical protein
MRNQLIVYVLLFTNFIVTGLCISQERQSQTWNAEIITGKLTNSLSVFARMEHRYDNKKDALNSQHIYFGINFKIFPWLTCSPYFRAVNYASGKTTVQNDWYLEYRPSVDFVAKYSISYFDLSYREEIERRLFSNQPDAWSYRQKAEIKYKQGWTSFKIRPYLADEVYYQKNKDGFYRNWIIAGTDVTPIPKIKAGLYYIWQRDRGKNDVITNTDIWALQFNFDF